KKKNQENINGIVAAFYMCARSDGDCGPLSREELRQLIEQEFVDAMENPQDPKTVKKVLCFLEDSSSCRVDFSELLSLVFRMAKACYKPLQQHQAQEDGQELTVQKKKKKKQPLGPHTAGRVSRNQQIPEQGVSDHVQDTEMLDPKKKKKKKGETPEQDQDTHQTQKKKKKKQDLDTHQTRVGETPKKKKKKHQTQEGETSKQDLDKKKKKKSETPEQDQDTHQTQEKKKKKKDLDTHQIQVGETLEKKKKKKQIQEGKTAEQDQHTKKKKKKKAAEGDPERGEILDTATPDQDRNTRKAEETETPKQDPKTQQAQETEAPGQGSNHHQSPDAESAKQDLNCPSETQGADPNKTQVFKALQQDPNPSKTQKLLPPQQGASLRRDPKPQGMCHDPACHQVPESKVLEQEHSGTEAPFCPAQQQQDAHHQSQPTVEQQLLQSLYQWPPQQ
ncbi:CRNN protein, partial [Herpetotheres cachinnans]|nr:CRNN protein [Herpetotheres cachinnans]